MMERAIVEYMINAVWQFPLLAAGAWLLLRAAKLGSQVQYDVWLAVLGLGVLLPAHGMATREPHPQPSMAVTYERTAGDKVLLSQKPHLLTHTVLLNAIATRWLVRLYLATVVLALLRIARSWIVARGLVVHSRATSRQRAALAHYSQQFGVKIPQLRESGDVASPMIVGVRTPVLLLPEGFDGFPEDQVAAVFCHELAHIRRQDYLMNLFCQIAALPVAWHPVVYEVQQRIRTTREMICDAMAAQEIGSHVGYAKCLLALAHSMLAERGMTGPAPISRPVQQQHPGGASDATHGTNDHEYPNQSGSHGGWCGRDGCRLGARSYIACHTDVGAVRRVNPSCNAGHAGSRANHVPGGRTKTFRFAATSSTKPYRARRAKERSGRENRTAGRRR